jgi:hypothetical protein
MPDSFVDLEIETDSQTLADAAVSSLQAQWPGWQPNDGDLEVVQIEALAPLAANAADVAAIVPATAVRTIGTKLFGISYNVGQPATGMVTFTFIDSDPHDLHAGDEIDIDGYAFQLNDDHLAVTSPVGGVFVTCNVEGAGANGLAGTDITANTSMGFVDTITLDAPTAGGVDEEDDAAYQDRLTRELELRGRTIVSLRDVVLTALNTPGIGRAVAFTTADRAITVVFAGEDGEVASGPAHTALSVALSDPDSFLVNSTYSVSDPTYTTVNVAYTYKLLPTFNAAETTARINDALAGYLSPTGFAQARQNSTDAAQVATTWIKDAVVRVNTIVGIIESDPGVNYVGTVTITAAGGTTDGAGNVTLPGTVALPHPGTMSGTTI